MLIIVKGKVSNNYLSSLSHQQLRLGSYCHGEFHDPFCWLHVCASEGLHRIIYSVFHPSRQLWPVPCYLNHSFGQKWIWTQLTDFNFFHFILMLFLIWFALFSLPVDSTIWQYSWSLKDLLQRPSYHGNLVWYWSWPQSVNQGQYIFSVFFFILHLYILPTCGAEDNVG